MKWTYVKWFLFAYKLTEHLIICWPLPSLPIHHVHPYPISWPASSETHPAHHPHPFSRMSPLAAAASSSIDPRHHHDPVPEPLPSGLFIPADQVHIYDFVNNYADDGYYDYDDEDSFQEKVRKWRENQRSRGYNNPDHKYNNDHTNAWLNSKRPSTSNKDGKQLEGSSSGLDNVAKNPDPSSSKNNNNNNNNENNHNNHNNHNNDKTVEFDDDNVHNRSSKDGPANERKELTSGEAKDIETLLEKSEIITGRSAVSSTSSSNSLSAPKTLPVEVSRHTITSPNGDMTVVTEMVYKNPYKPTPLPAYSHPPYLPSSRDGLYQPTDDPRLLHHQPHPPPPPPPPPSPSLENFGLGRSIGPGTTTYIPPPPRSSRNRDLATTPWTNGLGRVLPTPPTPFISSTSPSRSSPSSSSSSSSKSNKIAASSSNKRLNKQLDSNISKRNEISERSLSATAIAGIIIGSLVFVALLAGVALFIMYRRPTLPGTTRLPQRSTEWVEPQVNLSNNNAGNGRSTGVNACPPSDPLPVTSSHFTRTQRPINKTTVSNTLNRSIDGLLVVGDWTLVSPGSNYETLSKKGNLPRGS